MALMCRYLADVWNRWRVLLFRYPIRCPSCTDVYITITKCVLL